jgi:hypothetical protein
LIYKCKCFPYPIGYPNPDTGMVYAQPRKVLPYAYKFIEEWESETPEPHYVEVKCFGAPARQVFISPAFSHIKAKANFPNIARRYRFLPCVKELLQESAFTPFLKAGSYLLEGKAPPYGELFLVVIEQHAEITPGFYGLRLSTFYPLT